MLGFSRLFDNDEDLWSGRDLIGGTTSALGLHPLKMDLMESENEYKAVFEVPGVPKDKVKVSFDNNMLTVEVNRKECKEQQTDRYHYRERKTGMVSRSVNFPEDGEVERAKAKNTDGILTVTVPKSTTKMKAPETKYLNVE